MRLAAFALLSFGAACAAACEGMGSSQGPNLERMIDQHKGEPFQTTSFLPNGRVMQVPPEGTVPRERVLGDPALTEGVVDGHLLEAIPVPVDAALLARGRNRYDIYCSPCHGVRGDSDSEVARRMQLRRPPALVDLLPEQTTAVGPDGQPIPPSGNSRSPGGIFQVITNGYGLMPNYRNELPPMDRWAVIAYVRALTISQRSTLDSLPPDLRREATQKLPAQQPPGAPK